MVKGTALTILVEKLKKECGRQTEIKG